MSLPKQPLEYNPLVLYWIAYYDNDKALPQFNPFTGQEYYWKDIDQKHLVKFGLYPFNTELSHLLLQQGQLVQVKDIKPFELHLQPNHRLIFLRRNYIKSFTYSICSKCDNKWMAKKGDKWEVKVTTMQNDKPHTYTSYKCTKCESYNVYVCPSCDQVVNKVHGEVEGTFAYECPRCLIDGKPTVYPRYVSKKESVYRYTKYLLGYQETVNGKNVKMVMSIDEDGRVRINDPEVLE